MPQSRMQTRAKNAGSHPGDLIPKQKRRTKEEMKRDRDEEAVNDDRKARKKKEGVERIASLEEKMAADDAKAKALPAKRPQPPLVRTKRMRNVLLSIDELDEPDSDVEIGETVSDGGRDELTSGNSNTSTEIIEKPPKKKAKVTVRASIDLQRKQAASGAKAPQKAIESVEGRESGGHVKVCTLRNQRSYDQTD